jgi:hypothetical protein
MTKCEVRLFFVDFRVFHLLMVAIQTLLVYLASTAAKATDVSPAETDKLIIDYNVAGHEKIGSDAQTRSQYESDKVSG